MVCVVIMARFEQGYRQYIIDIGGSFKNMVKFLGGQYLSYDPDNPFSFNPFIIDRNSDGTWNLTHEKLTFLTALISTIWKGSKEKELSQTELAVFAQLIPRFYEQLSPEAVPSLRHFYFFLKRYDLTHEDDPEYRRLQQIFNVHELMTVLEPFVAGPYRQVFHAGHDEELIQSRLVCF